MIRTMFALFFGVLLTIGPARADNCGALPNTLTNGTLADATQVMGNFSHLLACINILGATSAVRQIVTSGPVTTTGLPSFLPATSASLAVTSVGLSATTPLTVTTANGNDPTTGRQRDLVGFSTSNLTWSGLTANTTNYLYVTVAANGALAALSTIREPIYQAGGTPAIQNGQFTFNIGEMKGYLGNGSLAPRSDVVFVGEVVTGASTVTSTTAYAYNGQYEGIFTGPLVAGGNWVGTGHSIGVKPNFYDFIIVNITPEHTYAIGDTLHAASLIGNYGSFTLPLALTANRTAVTFFAASPTPYVTSNKGSAASVTLTPANWQYKFIARRGW
ncbi:hypothetical protein [Reyranella sp.]|uniref:hypothetical protein n=1 Tax=Reyranella sp. TaxID=1929291 RepID=UPI00378380D3